LIPPLKSHTERPHTNMRKLINGILYVVLYVVMTGYTWKYVPRRYGSKSTVHILHFYTQYIKN